MERLQVVEVISSEVSEEERGLVIALEKAMNERDAANARVAELSKELAKRNVVLLFR